MIKYPKRVLFFDGCGVILANLKPNTAGKTRAMVAEIQTALA